MSEQSVESTFLVTVRSSNVGAGLLDLVREQQTRNVLRALHLGIGASCEIHELEGTSYADLFRRGQPLDYDPKGDDMGHHGPEHDTPVIRPKSV